MDSSSDINTAVRLMKEELNTIGQAVGQLQGQVNELNARLSICQLLLPRLQASSATPVVPPSDPARREGTNPSITTPTESEKDLAQRREMEKRSLDFSIY